MQGSEGAGPAAESCGEQAVSPTAGLPTGTQGEGIPRSELQVGRCSGSAPGSGGSSLILCRISLYSNLPLQLRLTFPGVSGTRFLLS